MRRAAVLLTTVVLAACATVPSGIFARVVVGCGKQVLVFSNPDKIDERVIVKASDNCQGADSEVRLMDADDKVLKRYAVPDGKTETIEVLVRQGEWLNFACAGNRGSCSYSITSD